MVAGGTKVKGKRSQLEKIKLRSSGPGIGQHFPVNRDHDTQDAEEGEGDSATLFS